MVNCVYPQYGKKRTTYQARVYGCGVLSYLGSFTSEEIALARVKEFKSNLPRRRRRGGVLQVRERFYARAFIQGRYHWFGGFPNHYEARKALEKGLETLGLHPYR